jgi:uncharacterized protein
MHKDMVQYGEPLQSPALQDLQPTFLVANDQVIVLWRQRGVNNQTGEEFDMPAASVYKMTDGRVLEARMFQFGAALARAFLDRARA